MKVKQTSHQQLIDCYSDQAEHFGQTRQKAWPEFDYLINAIELYQSDTLSPKGDLQKCNLLELGCGTGRLYSYIENHPLLDVSYTGVDISEGMITQAKKNYPKGKWVVDEMNHYLSHVKQESVDIIVAVASIQHLMNKQERELFFFQAYRALRRGGVLLTINRSYSNWFLRKYRREQLNAGLRSLVAPKRQWNDLMIPWKDPQYQRNHKIFHRPYHMFTQYELHQLARLSGFVIAQSGFVQQDGTLHETSWKNARNSWLWLEKRVTAEA